MLCGYGSTFKAYDLPTLFHKTSTTNLISDMKRIFATLFLVITTITILAQSANDNTLKFLGHPVDGSKSQMEKHLRSKGFTYNSYSDCYKGKFNGKLVDVYISTNNGNVDRVYVAFPTQRSESDIINEYNILLGQFKNNDKYLELKENPQIPEDENLSYEMSVNNKRYEASYYYVPQIDTLAMQKEFHEELTRRYTPEQLEELTEIDVLKFVFEKLEDMLTGSVWFTIHEIYGKYQIGLYYDNLNNRPNGEDL